MTVIQPIQRPVHTYSVVAYDPATGEVGVAVQSHYFSVGPICPWVEAGVGAVATQSLVKVDYGPDGLARMRAGQDAAAALAELLAADDDREVRQVALVDSQGRVAAHTGTRCIAAASHQMGEHFSVQANMMVDESVVPAMFAAYAAAEGDLASRLLATLVAAQEAGGDIRGQQSAAIKVAAGERQAQPWQGMLFDLRVEDSPQPLEELARLVQLRRAYALMDYSDEMMVQGNPEAGARALQEAMTLASDTIEIQFWAGINQVQAGYTEAGHALLGRVFAAEPVWRRLVPRLVAARLLAARLLADDEEMIAGILGN